MRRHAGMLFVALLAILVAPQGCGGSEPYEKGASAPSAPAGNAYGQSPSRDTAMAARAPEPPPSPPALAPQTGSRVATLRQARGDFDLAQRELDVSAGDCRVACRALGSMDRAAGHLCDLASEVDDKQRCEEVKTKLFGARDRVRTTCGSCPGGASVERSAPVPSVP